ncbi:M15 family metallopeptidase [Oscillatoria sp. FACHB-1406]|uniref:M15 family metallopeptidase n=1 Tax=Oscillatoria sp. FACHB-1406 TaxID=2692846 RepID=UPI001F5498E3|nr:M15 family metallopeptidase [Oscillatoria sp. FACHB-1406]
MKIWNKAIAWRASKPTLELSNDIPEALRDVPPAKPRNWVRPALYLTGGLGLGAIAILSSVLIISQISQKTVTSTTPNANSNPDGTSSVPGEGASPVVSPSAPVENVLGHLPYKEASPAELEAIAADGRMRLHKTAAKKYREMAAAARASGVILAPISAFRTVEEQNRLFFEVKAQRNQVASTRAAVSAPPGYSEHHTGYAIDIGDGNAPSANLQIAFEKTAAFKWLEKNAPRYSFELSFPRNNAQGVSYEPWHWRYVGDIKSLEMFYRAHNLPK